MKGPDSVRNGIARVQEYAIYIHPKCRNFKSEIQLYAYKVDKDGKITGDPEKEYDYGMDAMRYGVTAVFVTGHAKVVEAKGYDIVQGSLLSAENVEKEQPKKKGHTRVVSTHEDPSEDWRTYYGYSYL